MRPVPRRNEILVPLSAGEKIMERYGLYCEVKFDWNDPDPIESAERIRSARAPYEIVHKEQRYRLNIAAKNEKFRQYSLNILEKFIEGVRSAPNCLFIVLAPPPRFWNEDAGKMSQIQEVGTDELLIDSLQRLCKKAALSDTRILMENACVNWEDIPTDENYSRDRHHGNIRECFAASPNEWTGLVEAVNKPNFGLCLDTSHAVTYSHRFPEVTREGILGLFLDLGGHAIHFVHWSDNYIDRIEGRRDCHLLLGKGSIPRKIHTRVWEHSSARMYLFDHWRHEGELADEARFVERL